MRIAVCRDEDESESAALDFLVNEVFPRAAFCWNSDSSVHIVSRAALARR